MPACGASAAKAGLRAKEKNSGDCVQRTTKGQCSRPEKCGMKYDPEKNRVNLKERERVINRVGLHDGIPWKEVRRLEKSFRK